MTTAMPETPLDESVDTSDLDSVLDDPHNHAFCRLCNPDLPWPPGSGALVHTICHRTALMGMTSGGFPALDPVCRDAIYTQTCPVHGYIGPKHWWGFRLP